MESQSINFKELEKILYTPPEELSKKSPEELAQLIFKMRALLYDPLTGLRDKRQFLEGLESEVDNNTAFAFFDVNDFKLINKRYTHVFGDLAISAIGEIIGRNSRCANSRKSDTIRYGGDEFLMILPETGIDAAAAYAKRILRQVEEHKFYTLENQPLTITLSAGVSHLDKKYNPEGKDNFQMIMEASIALHLSKRRGKNCVSKYEGAFSKSQLEEQFA